MKIATFLQDARDRIASPDHWCQGDFARDFRGNGTFATNPSACRWCLLGTLEKSLHHFGASYNLLSVARAALEERLPKTFMTLQHFNDHSETTHAMVLRVMDRTIAASVKKYG